MNNKNNKPTDAHFIKLFMLIMVLYQPFTYASASSANPYVVAGIRHTVGLKSDGLVLATGLNQQGQCNVGSWRDIVQVAAGGYFTVGLKSDGRVVAAGSNLFGRLNVNRSIHEKIKLINMN